MRVKAAKGITVLDPATGRAISDAEFCDVDASRYWTRRARDGSIVVDETPVPGYTAPKKSDKPKKG